jgi:hypothetical protein
MDKEIEKAELDDIDNIDVKKELVTINAWLQPSIV